MLDVDIKLTSECKTVCKIVKKFLTVCHRIEKLYFLSYTERNTVLIFSLKTKQILFFFLHLFFLCRIIVSSVMNHSVYVIRANRICLVFLLNCYQFRANVRHSYLIFAIETKHLIQSN